MIASLPAGLSFFHLVDLRLPADLYLYREAIDLNGAFVPSE